MATSGCEIGHLKYEHAILSILHDVIDGPVLGLFTRLVIFAFFTLGTCRDVYDNIFRSLVDFRVASAITLAVSTLSKPTLAHAGANGVVI